MKKFILLFLVFIFLSLTAVHAQAVIIPDEKVHINLAIKAIEQGIKQHRTELITRFLNKEIENGKGKKQTREQLHREINSFMSKTENRKQNPKWKKKQTRPNMPANWDFELNVKKVVVNGDSAIVKVEYNWLTGIPIISNSKSGNLFTPEVKIKDVWHFIKIGQEWRLAKTNKFIMILNKTNSFKIRKKVQ